MKFASSYLKISPVHRLLGLGVLMPAADYFTLAIVFKPLVMIAAFNKAIAFAYLFFILLSCVLTVAIICLFSYECIMAINKIKNKYLSALLALFWLALTLFPILMIGNKIK